MPLFPSLSVALSEAVQTIATSGASRTLSLADGPFISLTLSASCTLTFPGATAGYVTVFTLELVQGGSGSYTVTWPAAVKWAGGVAPALSTAVGAVDVLTFYSADGATTWRGFLAGSDVR